MTILDDASTHDNASPLAASQNSRGLVSPLRTLLLAIAPRRAGSRALLAWSLFALGMGSNMALRAAYDTRPVFVNVRWAPSVDDAVQHRLEERYGLVSGIVQEDRTWGYFL